METMICFPTLIPLTSQCLGRRYHSCCQFPLQISHPQSRKVSQHKQGCRCQKRPQPCGSALLRLNSQQQGRESWKKLLNLMWITPRKNKWQEKNNRIWCLWAAATTCFFGQFWGEILLKKTKLNSAFVFELPIHRMSANGNVEELQLHPWQHLCRKQLLATHD